MSELVLVVGVAFVDASVPLGGRVNLHLRLDAVLPTPELADLSCKEIIHLVDTLKLLRAEMKEANENETFFVLNDV